MSRAVGFLFAHPDDETFLCACLIRQLADRGERPLLLLATRGDAGGNNGSFAHLSGEALALRRVLEMEKAARVLGLPLIEHLGLPDGKLQTVDQRDLMEKVIAFINRHQVEIAVTFPEDGGNGHPDHIAISRAATAAVLSGQCPSVRKLYYVASETLRRRGRRPSFAIDTAPQWRMKAQALQCHESQLLAIRRVFGDLTKVPEHWRQEAFVLAWERGTDWPDKEEAFILD